MTSPDGAGSDPEPTPPNRPGASTFTIEGRAAPALFVVGWLATVLGLGIVVVAAMSGGGAALGLVLVGLVALSVGLIAAAGSQGLERRARGVLPYQGPSPLLVFAAAVPVSLLVIYVVVGLPLTALGIKVDSPIGNLLSIAIQALVYAGLIRLLVVDTRALSWAEMGVRRPDGRALGEVVWGAAWAIPVIFATIPVSLVLLQLFPVTPVSPLPPTGEATGFLLQFAAGAVFAPIGEELMFRGLATTAWVRGLGVRRGLVRAALVFALAHVITVSGSSTQEAFGLAIVGFATRVPVALALGWLFVRRGSIWAPLGLHMAFNGILLIIGELAVGQPPA